jgi:capsular polysaccharide transport system permease protein
MTDTALDPPRPSLIRGLRVQGRVVGALIMRELHTRYGRENVGYIWLLIEPMLLATAVTIMHLNSRSPLGPEVSPVAFTLVSYCNFMTFRSIFNRAEGAVEANLPLMYHRMVSIFDIMFSRALLEAASTAFVLAFLMMLAIGAGLAELPYRFGYLLLGMAAMFLLSFGLALTICWGTYGNTALARLVHPTSYILLPLSGAFTSMQWLPHQLQDFFWYIPLAHIFELIRYGQFRTARLDFVDPGYLLAWIGGTLLVGLLGVHGLRKRIHMV